MDKYFIILWLYIITTTVIKCLLDWDATMKRITVFISHNVITAPYMIFRRQYIILQNIDNVTFNNENIEWPERKVQHSRVILNKTNKRATFRYFIKWHDTCLKLTRRDKCLLAIILSRQHLSTFEFERVWIWTYLLILPTHVAKECTLHQTWWLYKFSATLIVCEGE